MMISGNPGSTRRTRARAQANSPQNAAMMAVISSISGTATNGGIPPKCAIA